jgi:hypothetical protein
VSSAVEKALVVVCHYNARPVADLTTLLTGLRRRLAGGPFDVLVVVNQAVAEPLVLPAACGPWDVYYRPNTGFNLGAWDRGWRARPGYGGYLFLQEECHVVRDGWLGAFARCGAEPGVGLVGECLSPTWDAPWEELARRFRGARLPDHAVAGQPADRLSCYWDFFRRRGIHPGPRGDHLQSLVLFARRAVLEAVGGFPPCQTYGEAVAAEIGLSKQVQALGLTLRQVGAAPFTYFEHPQWLHRRPALRPVPVSAPGEA